MRPVVGAAKAALHNVSSGARRGRIVPVWVAADVAAAVEALVGKRQLPSRNAAFVLALEAGLKELTAATEAAAASAPNARPRKAEGFERVQFRSTRAEKRRIEAFQARHGYPDISTAISDLVTRALDAEDLGDNVPATKADEIDQRLQEVRELADQIGPGVFGILGLLSHWATQSGGLEVDEDELVEEAMTAGRQAWAMRQEIAADEPAEAPALGEEGGL